MNNHKGQRSSTGIDVKCECGKLLGIEKPTGIEVKCRGCKRVILIESKGGQNEESNVNDCSCSNVGGMHE